jgi:hypothetical protein
VDSQKFACTIVHSPTPMRADSGVQAEGRVRPEPRLTVPKICLGFIANSLFSATLIGSCRTKGLHSRLPQKTRWEKMVDDIDPDSGRPFIKVNHPAPTDIKHDPASSLVGKREWSCMRKVIRM